MCLPSAQTGSVLILHGDLGSVPAERRKFSLHQPTAVSSFTQVKGHLSPTHSLQCLFDSQKRHISHFSELHVDQQKKTALHIKATCIWLNGYSRGGISHYCSITYSFYSHSLGAQAVKVVCEFKGLSLVCSTIAVNKELE